MPSTNGVAEVLAEPTAHGFRFESETVKKKVTGKSYPAEIVIVEDVPLFDKSFPGVAKKAINGQSIRVGSQRVSREAEGAKSAAQLREMNVRWLLGIEQPGEARKIYLGPEDEEYETKEQAQAAWLESAGK
jgi:hypothetical protein